MIAKGKVIDDAGQWQDSVMDNGYGQEGSLLTMQLSNTEWNLIAILNRRVVDTWGRVCITQSLYVGLFRTRGIIDIVVRRSNLVCKRGQKEGLMF